VLGEQTVGFDVDRDVVKVGRREGRFSRIRLDVRGNDVFVRNVRVRYGNGEEESFELREEIRAGSSSRPIDLKGDRRAIDTIELTYRARPGFRGQATVAVLGDQRPDRSESAPAPAPDYLYPSEIVQKFNNWGRKRIEEGEDRAVFVVGEGREAQHTLLLIAQERPVHVRSVEITFGNGQRQLVELDDRLMPGTGTPPIELENGPRRITRVVVRLGASRGTGTLQLLASQVTVDQLAMQRWRRRR
jgi:hypothetical protein